jgi:hypothetical protein
MSNAARKRRNIRTEESLHRQRVAKKAVERMLESHGFEIVGQPRRIKNRHLIDVRDPSGGSRVLWFKLGWKPGDHGTSGVQIAMLKSRTGAQRPASLSDAEILKRVSRKFQRAQTDGVSHLLLFSLDNSNQVPIACLLMPITRAQAAFQEELQLDSRRARNGASPTFWIKGNDLGTRKLQQTVERFATENLVNEGRQQDATTLTYDAIDDFTPDLSVIGNDTPERRLGQVAYFTRNQQVRDQAIARADGRCEYCNQEGFLTSEGKRYLESHHIQALGEEGPDTEGNVIALCPNDHREAHFGRDAKVLATRMRGILARKLKAGTTSRRVREAK